MTSIHERGATARTASAERTFGPITRTDIVRYAGAGGDFNPIHHDDVFATSSGYPSVFGHGLLTAGILSTFAAEWLGRTNLHRFSVRYLDQVWPGDRLITRGEVDKVVTAEAAAGSDDSASVEVHVRLSVHARADDSGVERLVLSGRAVATYRDGETYPGCDEGAEA